MNRRLRSWLAGGIALAAAAIAWAQSLPLATAVAATPALRTQSRG